jgi:hypothetical protein
MFCPKCRAEFRSGFIRCNDCDIGLVDRLPETPPQRIRGENIFEFDHDEYVAVSSVQRHFEQEQICSFLQAYGIPTRIRSHGLRETYGITVGSGGSGEILVPREYAADARDLLAKADRGDLKIDRFSGQS